MTVSINPFSVKDSRWKWFAIGVLIVQRPDFVDRIGELPQENSPNLAAYNDGIIAESSLKQQG